jgi:cell fate regulator YaaT (PSP1 superfamily)
MICQIEITPFRTEYCESDMSYTNGELVVIRSKEGIDLGRIVRIEKQVKNHDVYATVIRRATQNDLEKRKELREYEEFSLLELKRAVDEFKFAMKPVYAHCQLDEERVIFYFTAQKRLEFRKLHRFISQKLNRRVVIKQIGSRDYSKLFGGIGPCGRNLCCKTFLSELKSISLRMARDQKLYVSPSKISGICGRLLCCLNFEEDFYADFQDPNEQEASSEYDDQDHDTFDR